MEQKLIWIKFRLPGFCRVRREFLYTPIGVFGTDEEGMEMFWKWDDSLNIGVEVIDRQHRRIVEYMNQLHSAHREGDRDKVETVLHGLIDYTVTHFTFEESLMEQAGYPISEAHKKVHESFVKRVRHFHELHKQGESVAPRLLSDLRVWLTNHIRNDDLDYRPYVEKFIKRQQGGWLKRSLTRFFG